MTPRAPAGYEIEAPLGSGGGGSVWRARAADGRVVALKILPALDGENLEWRFRREVEAAALQEHPGIARVLASGVHEGRPWLAMDLIEGAPLDVFLAENEPPLRERLALFLAICAAVQHAHGNGVLHRDLKPANILIRADATPVVLDFGLARFLGDTAHGPTLSLEGEAIGTPLYMAPEQAAGKKDAIGVTADVYSLGVILYEMLTGAAPYDRALPPLQLLRAVCETDPRPPRVACPALDRDLDAIIMRAMARNRSDRYATVTALCEDVQRFLDHRPVRARRWSAGYALRRAVRRHWLPAGILLIVAALGAAWMLEKARAAEESRRASKESERADDAQTRSLQIGRNASAKIRVAEEDTKLARTLMARGDYPAAHIHLTNARALLYSEHVRLGGAASYRKQVAEIHADLGEVLLKLGNRKDAAISLADAAESWKEARLAGSHPRALLHAAECILRIFELGLPIPERFRDPDRRLAQLPRWIAEVKKSADSTAADKTRADALADRHAAVLAKRAK